METLSLFAHRRQDTSCIEGVAEREETDHQGAKGLKDVGRNGIRSAEVRNVILGGERCEQR